MMKYTNTIQYNTIEKLRQEFCWARNAVQTKPTFIFCTIAVCYELAIYITQYYNILGLDKTVGLVKGRHLHKAITEKILYIDEWNFDIRKHWWRFTSFASHKKLVY